jgi:hypothetical protein
MFRLANGAWRWLRALQESNGRTTPYSLECACGATVAGNRRTTAQVRVCPVCKQKLFILGQSPLPRPTSDDSLPAGNFSSHARLSRFIVILGTSVVVLIAACTVVWLVLRSHQSPGSARESAVKHRQTAEDAWNSSDYATAAREFERTIRICQDEGAGDAAEIRDLTQKFKQADLIAHRLPERLDDLLSIKWKNIDDADLQTLFARRGRETAVAFDVVVWRRRAGQLMGERHLGPELPRMDLGSLPDLDALPLRQKQRVIFGARLAALERDRARPIDDPERWLLSFEPDSFVLLTDPAIVKFMGLAMDDETPAVLERQWGWLR